jgi:predicted TIM-barrel fold metal-dependent hydrolase
VFRPRNRVLGVHAAISAGIEEDIRELVTTGEVMHQVASLRGDNHVRAFVHALGVPGIVDVHVHFMPDSVQRKVWAVFDQLTNPPWPIVYRAGAGERLATLRSVGVVSHTALAYAHRPGMAAWLNEHTLALAAEHAQVLPTFTFYPEDGVDDYVSHALESGGSCAKVHLQVGKFDANDARLDAVWARLARARVPIILHAGAVADGSGGEEWCGVRPVARLLERFPDLPLVIAHLGTPDTEDFLALAETSPTVHFDTAMVPTDPPYLTDLPARLLGRIEALGDRILFGSDFPTIPHDYAAQVRGLVRLDFGDDWLRAALWHNPRRLLSLDSADRSAVKDAAPLGQQGPAQNERLA